MKPLDKSLPHLSRALLALMWGLLQFITTTFRQRSQFILMREELLMVLVPYSLLGTTTTRHINGIVDEQLDQTQAHKTFRKTTIGLHAIIACIALWIHTGKGVFCCRGKVLALDNGFYP